MQKAPILAHAEGAYAAKTIRWGLIRSWAKGARFGNRLINARVETVAEKPSFRVGLHGILIKNGSKHALV